MAVSAPVATIGASLVRNGRTTTATGYTITNDPGTLTVAATLTGASSVATYNLSLYQSTVSTFNIGNVIAQTGQIPSVNATTIAIPAMLGPNTVVATVDAPNTFFTISNRISLYELPAPVAGITTATLSSIGIAALRTAGYQMNFVDETTAIRLTDGTIGIGSTSRQALVQRLYLGFFSRLGDIQGLSAYDQMLANGQTATEIASQMMAGFEYGRRGPFSDQAFISDIYRGFVNRAPTAGETQAALGQIAAGTTRASLAATLAASSESAAYHAPSTATVFVRDDTGTAINEAYRTAFGREVETGGLTTYRNVLATGGTLKQFYDIIAASPEFRSIHLGETDAGFITSLYQAEFNRIPDAVGFTGYLALLGAGTLSRAALVQVIATSPEAQVHLPRTL